MDSRSLVLLLSLVAVCAGDRRLLQVTPATNFNPITITVSQAPFSVIATPITPVAPYSQAAFQCNVTGDSRIPAAGGTFPLTVKVPVGNLVRVIFANGNLNGATVTQQGEAGVIVQQGGIVIVQQAGGASPIVQPVGSPIVQQNAPPAALVVQQTPTVVQQNPPPAAPSVPVPPPVNPPPVNPPPVNPPPVNPPPVNPPPVTPTPTPPPVTPTPTPPPVTPTPTPPPVTPTPTPPPVTPTPSPTWTPKPTWTPSPTWTPKPTWTPEPTKQTWTPEPTKQSWTPEPTKPSKDDDKQTWTPAPSTAGKRHLLQETVPGGPNNGLVEYVALATSNTVPGFVVPNTAFGVPYVEFTATAAAAGQTATFKGVLEVAQVVGGVPVYPFVPNKRLSPECQVNVNFVVA